jgi:endonuclease III
MNRRTVKRDVERVCASLKNEYGHSRLNNPKNPLDDLVYVIMSNRTLPKMARRTYRDLKKKYPKWDMVLESKTATVKKILAPAGLSSIRTAYIRKMLRIIRRDFNKCTLRPLKRWDEIKAFSYLASLPGVSEKVAKCVMMYTLGHKVLPVDVHVHRISRRLGWINKNRADQSHEQLEAIIPPRLRYDYHVNCVMHGRKVCKANKPDCKNCCVKQYCRSIFI